MPYVPSPEREVYNSRFNRVLAVLIWAASAALAGGLLVSVHDARLLYVVPCGLFAYLAWAALWRPHLSFSDGGITVVNVSRTVSFPWEALIAVDTKYALTLYTPGRKWPVWSAPAPGTASTLRATRNETKGRVGRPGVEDTLRRPGDLLSTESGVVADALRRRWESLQAAGAIEPGVADDAPVSVRWHLGELAVLVVLAAGTVAALLAA
ncbi:PH domain-containing protein [Leifsonia sp. AG29]|uniref:PH domain-containing protein n=1 Tax=Leifsonia sp. AG29 TaxID=2598860 RepID=UPI00131DC72C|nr:PH domain-containing protein [Leifsonia sp. AG29]